MDEDNRNPNMTVAEFRKHWCAALRSGKYQQCRGKLCRIDNDTSSFCCLGVACEIYHQLIAPLDIVEKGYGEIKSRHYDGYPFQNLPKVVAKQANMNPSGTLGHGSKAAPTSLTLLNDSGNKTFSEIADVIETENFEEYSAGYYPSFVLDHDIVSHTSKEG